MRPDDAIATDAVSNMRGSLLLNDAIQLRRLAVSFQLIAHGIDPVYLHHNKEGHSSWITFEV